MTELAPFLPEEDLCPAMTDPHLWGRTADGKERECLWCLRMEPTILAGPDKDETNMNYSNQPEPEDDDSDLRKRQEEHLRNVRRPFSIQKCLHTGCPECIGTGIKRDGTPCIHMISCPCPRCTPRF